MVKENPTDKDYPYHRGLALIGRGLARRALGDAAGAAADIRQALSLTDGLPVQRGISSFFIACYHAALSGLVGQEGAGVSDAERKVHADQAIVLLRKAVDMGYRDAAGFRTESALDPLRERDDFKNLLAELEKPSPPRPEK